MRSFASYSILAVIGGAGLVWANHTIDVRSVETFYGIASTTETEINFSEPIEVTDIYVRAGDLVDSGQVLMRVMRASKAERLVTEPYRIAELQAERALEQQQITDQLRLLDTERDAKLSELRGDRAQLAEELAYRRRLMASVAPAADSTYRPLSARIAAIDAELAAFAKTYEAEREALLSKRALATAPAAAAVGRLRAEATFNRSQDSLTYEIVAPARGLVGSLNAKIGEHKSGFAPLISFYEPSPRQVLSYVHEDKLLDAAVGDSVLVSSLATPASSSVGVVTGLGSRIIEIPRRLRRMPDIPTYGREVVVAIAAHNAFLQEEKVSLTFVAPHE